MKIKVSDYIAKHLVKSGINNVFTVVGGGAMHLNNAFGQCKDIKVIYNHHEQASAIAAEGYARINNKIAAVCVTTGPGGTNALTGVLCGWLDSIPMLIISGQVRYATTIESTGLKLRQFGEQEYNIIDSVKPMTKYAVMVKDAMSIRYHLERAIYEAYNGRKGPVWLDIPLDIQAALVEEEELIGYMPCKNRNNTLDAICDTIVAEIKNAKAPVMVVGSAVRQTSEIDSIYKLAEKLNIPVICPTSIADCFYNGYPLYFGNFGVFGGRTGNFIVQNADLIFSLGARMSFKQTGFNFEAFAPNAKKIIVDIDEQELKKDTIKVDMPVHADVIDVISTLNHRVKEQLSIKKKWLDYCISLRSSTAVNPYYLASKMQEIMPDDNITVVGNSCACVSLLQMGVVKREQRIFGNVNCGTMGYDIPAAIGASVASGKQVICATGDGSFQMNIQELQTIVHNKVPVKFIIFNNSGYQAIVQTQTNFFNGKLSGCTNESGISFPEFEKIAYAYGIPFKRINTHSEVENGLKWLNEQECYAICEVLQDTAQPIEPKVMSKKLEDGTLVSPPINDLSPFLGKEEYEKYAKFEY